jgi:para-nitrobenzyl esterase
MQKQETSVPHHRSKSSPFLTPKPYLQQAKHSISNSMLSQKKLFSTITICLLLYHFAIAGSGTLRYRDIVFPQVKTDSIIYSTQNGRPLYMHVYQPVGDTARQRPLIILAHGGSFMHGNRRSDCIPALCRELASRGFVVASIDYRLTNLAGMASKRHAYAAIIKAVADGRNSVRWFVNNAARENTYGINPDRIFFGGSSAGGILAEQLAYITAAAKCPSPLCKVATKFLPDSGALPAHAIRGCISLAGAVLDTNLVCRSAPPILHIQGDADYVVPFGCKRPVHGLAPFKLSGLGASSQRYKSQGLDVSEYVFINGGHTPWDHDDQAFKIVLQQVIAFTNRLM